MIRNLQRLIFVFAAALAHLEASACGAEWYVDNVLGDDLFSGAVPTTLDLRSGPVRTIREAIRRSRGGDIIHLTDHKVPYFESVEITAPRFHGAGLTIEGHGAVISGVTGIPVEAWSPVEPGLWKLIPRRKASYQLVRADRALTEHLAAEQLRDPADIAPGTWTVWRGALYYRPLTGPGQAPDQSPLGLAARDVGLTVYDVNRVRIRDVTFRHFRVDGVNAHDRAQDIVLENVNLIENGRSGLAVGGTSVVDVRGGRIAGNRKSQVCSAELGTARLTGSTVEPGPGGTSFRIAGGRLIVDDHAVTDAGE